MCVLAAAWGNLKRSQDDPEETDDNPKPRSRHLLPDKSVHREVLPVLAVGLDSSVHLHHRARAHAGNTSLRLWHHIPVHVQACDLLVTVCLHRHLLADVLWNVHHQVLDLVWGRLAHKLAQLHLQQHRQIQEAGDQDEEEADHHLRRTSVHFLPQWAHFVPLQLEEWPLGRSFVHSGCC